MTWWAWTLLWVVLVLAGAGFLYLAVRRVLRQGMALARELGAAADTLAEVTRALETLESTVDTAAPPVGHGPAAGGTPGRRGGPAGWQDVR